MVTLKKIAPFLLIALFVGWFSYKFFIERKPPSDKAIDWEQLDAASGTRAAAGPLSVKNKDAFKRGTLPKKNAKIASEENQFSAYDEVETAWLTSLKALFGPEEYADYLKMREKNEKEKMDAYERYHHDLREKHGKDFVYSISEDQSAEEKSINQRYLKELLKRVGEKKFQDYLRTRDHINEKNRRQGLEFIQMEF